ncbi:hypothetical protein [Actinospica durhamensis]|nr:hypothetical protein [Actinospica durhamensis]
MDLGEEDLLPSETVVLSKSANAMVRVSEFGLSRFAFDRVMVAAGLGGVEAIGGKLYVTDCRVVFKSHAVNRVRGAFSVFLPTVRDLRDTSSGIKRQLELASASQRFTFVVWGVPKVIAAIEDARARLDPAAVSRLAESATAHSARLGEGLQTAAGIETVNRFLTGLTHPGTGGAPSAPGTLAQTGLSGAGMSTALNLAELQYASRSAR